jgi:hypothetical protein
MKKRISVASAKSKGRNLQKWACEQISRITGISWGYEDEKLIQPRLMGQAGTDCVLRGEARKFLYDVECKATENISLYADIEQASKNTGEGRKWLLIHKKRAKKPIVVMDAKTFFDLVGETFGNNNKV